MREAAHTAEKRASGGRPRSESCRIALLETAFGLMKQHPIHAISTQHIAAEAGVSTATLYRWWPTKEALLLDAFLHVKQRQMPLKESDSPLQRIRDRFVASGKSLQGENGVVAARLMAAIQDDPQLRDAFAERFYGPHRAEMMGMAKEAVKAGELPARTDLKFFLDSLFGACMVRLMMRHESIHYSDLAQSFDLAVAAARSYWGEQ